MSIKELFEKYHSKSKKEVVDTGVFFNQRILKEDMKPVDRLFLARERHRPTAAVFLDHILDEKVIFKGDRLHGEDGAIIGGIGKLNGLAVTFVVIDKGNGLEEKIDKNFGMVSPEGFRKAIRLFKQAEKFNRPILTIIDTPGAYPGVEAENNGQSSAIANALLCMSTLKVPIVSVIIGEGYSGGALSLALCDHLIMMENAVFSILSPEGFGSIIFRDSTKIEEAATLLKFTAEDMRRNGICDEIVEERVDPTYEEFHIVYETLREKIYANMLKLQKVETKALIQRRHKRYDQWD